MPNTPPQQGGSTTGARPGELLERFLARLIDGVLLAVVFGVLTAAVSPGSALGTNLVLTAVFTAASLAYYAFLDSSRGQTVGKMVMKLQVRGASGSHPTVEESLRRNVLYVVGVLNPLPIIGWLASLAQLAGAIAIAVTIAGDKERRQGWHDKFAGGTTVVKLSS